MAVRHSKEVQVQDDDPMPAGYRFVPKGNVYITKHCRTKTHEAGNTLYVVIDKKGKRTGLRCPRQIYQAVLSLDKDTAARRAEAVQKRDAALKISFEESIVRLFPQIPREEVPLILRHSLKKHSRRVGRASTVELQDRVKLAVRAHIRHTHTDYDQLLKQGVSRPVARERVWGRLNEVALQWGGRAVKQTAQEPARGKKRAKRSGSTKAMSSGREREQASGTVKKAVLQPAVHARVVVTRRMSREDTLASPSLVLREAESRPPELATDDKGFDVDIKGRLQDADIQAAVFMADDTDDSECDCSKWGLGGGPNAESV